VCVKQVLDDGARLVVREDGRGLDVRDAWTLSALDRHALEQGLRIREAAGGEVVVLHVGPDHPPSVLTECLALGADAAVQVWDDLLDEADALVTARVLAAALRRLLEPFDLVLAGQRGIGEDDGQVPAMLAETLGVSFASAAVCLDLAQDALRVECDGDSGREIWDLTRPAVISAHRALNDPRQKSLKGVLAAKKKPVRRVDVGELGLGAADLAPVTRRTVYAPAPSRRAPRLFQGPPHEQVAALLAALRQDGVLR
jgi:electron transfer flavoprotein beta subunit